MYPEDFTSIEIPFSVIRSYLFYNDALAEDITQDVFHELCLQWEQLEKTYIGAWLYKTADHMVLQAKQKYARSIRRMVVLDETYARNVPAEFDVHEKCKSIRSMRIQICTVRLFTMS